MVLWADSLHQENTLHPSERLKQNDSWEASAAAQAKEQHHNLVITQNILFLSYIIL